MHTTEQLNSALAGRYAIERRIGEGGMAVVYVAHDSRHGRRVALKVLKPELGVVVFVDRFLAEIRVTAKLQHPNLLPLFDSGAAGDILYYVMPYVEGESLRQRIDREKQLPVDEAIRIATAVASALDSAHRQGVIHRDLKPENILLHDGQPLVADFGIALALSIAGGSRITQTGVSLGTPQYMSPEQATGDRVIDARSDIYSLSAVTYEMLTGEPPHTGTSAQAIIARVLTERPRSIRATRANVPEHIAAAVEHGLEKLAADRFATARDFSDALTGARPVATPSRIDSSPMRRIARALQRPSRLREAVLAFVAVIAIGVTVWQRLTAVYFVPASGKFPIALPDSVFVGAGDGATIALSRDGSQLVFVGYTPDAVRHLYLQRLGDAGALLVRGGDSAAVPTFSPDGKWIAFFHSLAGGEPLDEPGEIRIVPVDGGTPSKVVSNASPASWSDDNRIVFARRDGLWIVSKDGGEPRRFARTDSTVVLAYSYPEVLPGSRYVLVDFVPADARSTTRLGVVSLADGSFKDLKLDGANAHYAAPGFIVFGRGVGDVYAAPFSLRRQAVTGPESRVMQDVSRGADGGTGLAVSQNGVIVFKSGRSVPLQGELVAVDRKGEERTVSREAKNYQSPRVSPDGLHIAVAVGSPDDYRTWIVDRGTGASALLTPDGMSTRAEWSRDGTHIVFARPSGADSALILSQPWDRSAAEHIVARFGNVSATGGGSLELSIGPAHGLSVIRRGDVGAELRQKSDLLLAPTDSLASTRPLFSDLAPMMSPRISPNGRLLAFASTESGRSQIFVTPIPGPGPRVPISVDGGSEPAWSNDGKTLYYRGGPERVLGIASSRMIAATLQDAPAFGPLRQDTLFADHYLRSANHANYDVFPDGRFLMVRPYVLMKRVGATLYTIMNWQQLLLGRSALPQ
jgi:serine/threonine-protein kinase